MSHLVLPVLRLMLSISHPTEVQISGVHQALRPRAEGLLDQAHYPMFFNTTHLTDLYHECASQSTLALLRNRMPPNLNWLWCGLCSENAFEVLGFAFGPIASV